MRKSLITVFCLLAFGAPAVAETPVVPAWFRPDANKPYAIFDAWRNLSTSEAMLVWENRWGVSAGCLKDERGKPIADCPLYVDEALPVGHPGSGRMHPDKLKTDRNGCFIVYSPYRDLAFYAAPGYPFSPRGYRYAQMNGALVECGARAIQVSDERRFYVLTCRRKGACEEKGLKRFFERELAQWKRTPCEPNREQPSAWQEQKTGSKLDRFGPRSKYLVRVVSPTGKPIPDALLTYSAWDRYGIANNQQTVATDNHGDCTLFEQLLSGQEREYYDSVRRQLYADIPGFAFGPIRCHLKRDMVNIITAKNAATVVGKMVDWNGNPECGGSVEASYWNATTPPNFGLGVAPDGTFSVERIMPGEPFGVSGHGTFGWAAPSETITLAPGEVRKGVVLKIYRPAAVRCIVVDENDSPVAGVRRVSFLDKSGGGVGDEPAESDNRFGMSGLVPNTPLHIEVVAPGFPKYVGPEFSLRPGEMRFVKVVVRRATPKQPSPAGNH